MAEDLRGFNADEHEEMMDFSPVPPGDYVVILIEDEKKMTKAGTGHYLNLRFEILEGEYKGRNLFVILNLWNPSEEAVQIARRELATICKAVGVPRPENTAQLHNIPMVAVVKTEKNPGYADKNVIKNYKSAQTTHVAPANVGNGAPAKPTWAR